jgi:phosphatidylinositol-3,4,5-trisphosphate 3-phosphatase/dual-specificity protein phosphatase PTEN
MTSAIRGLVSKKKKRFQEDGFDLDLTYVTPRLIAMGFPSTGIEGMYRNPMPEVQRFFNTRHAGHYRIYNLCVERAYDLEGYFPSVKRFPFEDHNPCALPVLRLFCEDVDAFLAESAENVVAIHCKAGKGRTGLCVATYMLHSRVAGCTSAEEALRIYAEARTHNAKGVTIPSQRRYVHYYEHEWRFGRRPPRTLRITHVRLCTVPHFDKGAFSHGGGCDPYFRAALQTPAEGDTSGLLWKPRTIYDYKKEVKLIKKFTPHMRFADLDVSSHDLRVRGDVRLTFYDGEELTADCKMFHLWFNTGYVQGEDGVLTFEKAVIDKANKDKHCKRFDPCFKVQIFFEQLAEGDADSTLPEHRLHKSMMQRMGSSRRGNGGTGAGEGAGGGAEGTEGVGGGAGSGGHGGAPAPPAAGGAGGGGVGGGGIGGGGAGARAAAMAEHERLMATRNQRHDSAQRSTLEVEDTELFAVTHGDSDDERSSDEDEEEGLDFLTTQFIH